MAQVKNLSQLIYDYSPYLIKNLIASSYGLIQKKKRYGVYYWNYSQLLLDSQYWEQQQLENFQKERLSRFIESVHNRINYYTKDESYNGLIWNAKNLCDFPVLSKKTVKQNLKDFYSLDSKNIMWDRTSGTTGSPMHFPISMQAYQIEYAFRYLHYQWAGIELNKRDKIAMCAGHLVTPANKNHPPFWNYDAINNQLYFSSYHLSDLNIHHYIKKLQEFNPLLLHGYPSSILTLALAYKKHFKKPLKLKSIITSSETLMDIQRKQIEEIFQVKVYNWYGTSERSANIIECDKGELHLKAEHSYVEILDENNLPVAPGESGRLITTNFNNEAFPLIRYDVGDNVTVSKEQSSKCGRNGLIIDSIDGRNEDCIHTQDGRKIYRLGYIFKDSINIIESQIEQYALNKVILRIVKNVNYTKVDEKIIALAARKRLGNQISVEFEYVNAINRSSNGKFRYIISNI